MGVFNVLRDPLEFFFQEWQHVGSFKDEDLCGWMDGLQDLHQFVALATRMMAGVVEGVASEAKRNEIARRSARMLEDRKMGLFHAFLKFRHRVSVVEELISATSQFMQTSVVRCRTLRRRGAHLVIVCKRYTAGFAEEAAKRV